MVPTSLRPPSHADNDLLFTERQRLIDQITDLQAIHDMVDTPETARALDRLRAELDEVHATLVEANTGLVVKCIRPFLRGTDPDNVEDIRAAARLGLWSAVCSFQLGRGNFSSWAHLHIRRFVHDAVNTLDHPTLSQSDFAARPRIRRAVQELRGGVDPHAPVDHAAVARESGCSARQVSMVLDPPRLESLARPVDAESEVTLADVLEVQVGVEGTAPDTEDLAISRVMAADALRLLDRRLRGRERMILIRRFGLDGDPPETRTVIGARLGISREMVRRLENRALDRLRTPDLTTPDLTTPDLATSA